MQETAERMIRGSAESYGVQYKIDVMGKAESVACDEDLSDMVKEAAQSVEGVTRVFDIVGCTGSEDCSLLITRFNLTAARQPSSSTAATTTVIIRATSKFRTPKVCQSVWKCS